MTKTKTKHQRKTKNSNYNNLGLKIDKNLKPRKIWPGKTCNLDYNQRKRKFQDHLVRNLARPKGNSRSSKKRPSTQSQVSVTSLSNRRSPSNKTKKPIRRDAVQHSTDLIENEITYERQGKQPRRVWNVWRNANKTQKKDEFASLLNKHAEIKSRRKH